MYKKLVFPSFFLIPPEKLVGRKKEERRSETRFQPFYLNRRRNIKHKEKRYKQWLHTNAYKYIQTARNYAFY